MEKKAFFAVAKNPWEKEPYGRAQISLEYLLTYSWALVLVASIVGVVVLLFGSPVETPVFNSSQPIEFPLVGGNIDAANNVSVVLKNASRGTITVTGINLISPFTGSAILNGNLFTSSVSIGAGEELRFTGINYASSGTGTIIVIYKDKTEFSRTLTITGKKGAR